jgi:hypothetical protein
MKTTTNRKSDVRSALARSENRVESTTQCEKTYKVPAQSIFGRFAGQTIRCDRPASGRLGVISFLVGGAPPGALRGFERANSLLDCAASPSIRGRSCATDRGRSECRTFRQESIADKKPGRYVPFAALAAGSTWS